MIGQLKRSAFTLSPAAAGALPRGEPWGVFFFFVFGLVRFMIGQLKRLAFALSPAAAGALPVGEPWGVFSFLFLGWFVLRLVSLIVWLSPLWPPIPDALRLVHLCTFAH